MPAVTRALHPALAPYVVSCVGFDFVLPPETVHHGLPSPTLTVVLSFDEPLDCGWLGEEGSEDYWSLVSGLHDTPALIRTHGRQHGLQLALTPLGARALLGLPAGELGRTIVSPEATRELREALPGDLHDRLSFAGWAERFDVVEAHLLARLHHDERPSEMVDPVAEAWRLLVDSGGRLAVDEVAVRVGWSRRHLQARFAAEFGIGPKRLGRVVRFDRAHRLQESGVPLAEAAHRAGYADQSHLHRDWRALAGQTPRETAEDFPIVLSEVG